MTTLRIGYRRRGIATFLAVTMVALMGATFVAMTAALSHDLKRTTESRASAQLRQLLLAGAADVAARSRTWAAEHPAADAWRIPLPGMLAADGASISVMPSGIGPNTADVRIDALLAGRTASQIIHFTRHHGRWEIAAVELK